MRACVRVLDVEASRRRPADADADTCLMSKLFALGLSNSVARLPVPNLWNGCAGLAAKRTGILCISDGLMRQYDPHGLARRSGVAQYRLT